MIKRTVYLLWCPICTGVVLSRTCVPWNTRITLNLTVLTNCLNCNRVSGLLFPKKLEYYTNHDYFNVYYPMLLSTFTMCCLSSSLWCYPEQLIPKWSLPTSSVHLSPCVNNHQYSFCLYVFTFLADCKNKQNIVFCVCLASFTIHYDFEV